MTGSFMRGFLASLMLALLNGGALAQVSDRVHFRVGPQIIAWIDGQGPVRGDALDLSGDASGLRDWAGAAPGRLVPVGLGEAAITAPQVKRLAIASNSAFTLRAERPMGALGAWAVEIRLTGQGEGAQAGRLVLSEPAQLAGGDAVLLASSPDKTARRPGSAHSQALMLDITLTPLSTEAADTPPRLKLLAGD